MAKKQSFELDDYGFSADLDMPDFSFEAGEIKDDRKPSTKPMKIASAVGNGMIDQAMSPAFIRRMIKESLPQGYGSAMDMADQTAGTLRNLYNDAAKEIKPVVKDLKRVTKRMMPQAEAVLPSKMAAKVKAWANSDSDNPGGGNLTAEQLRDQALQAQLGEIFKFQTEQQLQERTENETRSAIRDNIEHDRHRDMFGQLDTIRIGIEQLASYQNKVDAAYQRKSLELQFRHYFVAMDSLAETKRFNAVAQTSLESIQKNTGLPEFVKLKNSERLHEAMRNKFIDGLQNTIFSRRRDMVSNVGKNLATTAKEKLSGFLDNVKSGIGMADSMADMREMQQDMAEMGMDAPSGAETAGGIAGGMVADSFGKRVGKKLRTVFGRNEKVNTVSNRLQYGVENAPQLMVDFARSDKGESGGMFDPLLRTVKDAILMSNSVDNSVVGDNVGGMQDPQPFNRLGQKSLTEIIPGFLARIYRELQMTRTGNDKIELTTYDFNTSKFVDRSTAAKNAFKSMIKDDERKRSREEMDDLIKELDPEGKLTPAQKKALGNQLLNDNLRNASGSGKRLSNYDAYTGEAGRYADQFSEMFGEYFADDTTGSKQQAFAKKFSRLGQGISDSRKTIQDQVNVGNRDFLEEFGLLDVGGTQINMRKLQEYFYGNDFTPADVEPQRTGPTRRRLGDRNRRPQLTSGSRPTVQPNPFTPPPAPTQPTINPFQQSNEELVKAIKESSSMSAVVDVNETLLRIEKRLNEGFGSGNGPGGPSAGPAGGNRNWWNMTAGELGAGAWNFGKRIGNTANNLVGRIGGEALGGLNRAYGLGKNILGRGMDSFTSAKKKIADVYVAGELIPRLQALKLQGGNYYYVIEDGKKKFIKNITEISGDVFGEDGKLVMTAEDAKKAWIKLGAGQKLLSAFTKIKDASARFVGELASKLPAAYGLALQFSKKAYDMLLDGPQDVYVQGNPNPVLLARTMRVGGYASRVTSKEIRKPSDIDGPVVDSTGQVVLSAEDLAKGLLNKNGKPLRTGLGRLVGMGQALFGKAKAAADWVWDGVKSGAKRASDALGGMFKEGGGISVLSGNSVGGGSGGNSTIKLLMQIRNLLNQRLPGEPTTFDDSDLKASPLGAVGAGLFAKGKQKLRDGWANVKSMFGNFAKKDGLQISGMQNLQDVMTDMRKKLADEKRKRFGDDDGDGVRDGSYKDWLRKQKDRMRGAKDKLAEKATAAGAAGKGLLGTVGGGLKGLYDKFRGNDDDEDGLDIDIDTDGNRRGRKKKAPRGFWGKTKHYAKGAGKGLVRGAGALGRGALALGGLGIGGMGALGGGLASGAAAVGGAAATAGGALLSGAGALAAGIGSVLSAPVLLGAAAVAAVGIAGYYGYKYLTRKKLDFYSTPRYAQYGFMPTDEAHVQAVLGLEDDLVNAVVYAKDGTASLDGNKANLDNLKDKVKSFGIDLADEAAVSRWFRWFGQRFKPVFLTWATALRKVNPQKSVNTSLELTPEEQKQFFKFVRFAEGPYDVMVSPFADLKSLQAGAGEVKAAFEKVDAELAKLDQSKKDGSMGAGVVATTAAGAATLAMDASGKPVATASLSSSALADVTKQNASPSGMNDSRGVITAMGVPLAANQFSTGKLDAMTVIRFKTYGLKQMELEKVRALTALEAMILKGVTFGKGNVAKWEGSVEKVGVAMAPSFGVSSLNSNQGTTWMAWFNTRFLPTFMNYLTALATATGKQDAASAYRALTAQQAVDVAMVMRTSNGSYSGSSLSVWNIPASPWPDYEVGSEVGITDNNLQGLKDEAKRKILDEPKGQAAVGADGKSTTSANTSEPAPTTFWGKAAKSVAQAASSAWKGAKDAVSGFFGGQTEIGGGMDVAHTGKGTGGDINAVPKPKGNKSWAALKDTISAAAKMVGVDERLMASIAAIESGFDYTVKAGSSSATGLFQFIKGTWDQMLKKYGPKYGIDPNTPATDPRANALLGGEFLKENSQALKGVLSRNVTDTDLYMAHFLGAGGAKQFFKADPKALAANVMPSAARSNPSIFYDNGRPRTIAEVYAVMNDKVRSRGKQFGIDAGSEAIVTTAGKPPTTVSAAAAVSPAPASTPAATASPATAKAAPGGSNPLGIPVADKTPGAPPVSTPMKPQTNTDNMSVSDLHAMGQGIGAAVSDPKTRNVNVQQQAQRDYQTQILGNIHTVSADNAKTLSSQLDVLREIRDHLLKKPPVTSTASKAGNTTTERAVVSRSAPKQAQAVTPAPVSMAKPSY